MEPRDPLISEEEAQRFAQDVVVEIIRQGLARAEAQQLYDASLIPEGLRETPEYYLHESPYYWACYLLTGDRRSPQLPPGPMERSERAVRAALNMVYEESVAAAEFLLSRSQHAGNALAVELLRKQMETATPEYALQLAEACSGHWEARPTIAFVGLTPTLQPSEDAPCYGTPFAQWLAFYQNRFDRRKREKIYWWNKDGNPGGPIPLFNRYEKILTQALGEGARLGWDAIVANVIPYKLPGPLPAQWAKAVPFYLPRTLRLLDAIGVEVVVTFGKDQAAMLAAHVQSEPRQPLSAMFSAPNRVQAEGYHFTWIPFGRGGEAGVVEALAGIAM